MISIPILSTFGKDRVHAQTKKTISRSGNTSKYSSSVRIRGLPSAHWIAWWISVLECHVMSSSLSLSQEVSVIKRASVMKSMTMSKVHE